MINFYDLEQLVCFRQAGTLSETAERLHISQSTLTRSMQKLESECKAPLFSRTKNRIRLNETGLLAAEQAALVLAARDSMLRQIREFDRLNRTITLGSCSPLAVTEPHRSLLSLFPASRIAVEIKDISQLVAGLWDNTYQMIILPYCPEEPGLTAKFLFEERLEFSLPLGHRFAGRNSLTFAEMNGENMLLYQDLGFWRTLVDSRLPDSRFLVQSEWYSFTELVENSVLPCFVTDLALNGVVLKDRINVPISDPEARARYHLVCKKENQRRFTPLIQLVENA